MSEEWSGNQGSPSGDYLFVDCELCRDAVSARLDGEAPDAPDDLVDHHLARCPACRRWADDLHRRGRALRVAPVEPVPDLVAPILAAAATERRRAADTPGPARVALALVGLAQLVLALPGLLGDASGASVHVAREHGAWELALAAGLLVAALRPARTTGLVPVLAVLTATLLGSTAALLALGSLVGLAAPAAAHVTLESSDPAPEAVLDEPPASVVLRFSEPVRAGDDALRVFDREGRRVDNGDLSRPDGDLSRPDGDATLALALPDMGEGSYVATWRVVSVDAHPISGGFTFRVGQGSAALDDDLVGQLLSEDGGSSAVGAVDAVVRLLAFAALPCGTPSSRTSSPPRRCGPASAWWRGS